MADRPDDPPPVVDRPHAPVVYFEAVPTFGHHNGGVITLTLSTGLHRLAPDGVGVLSEQAVVAYLRCGLVAALRLRDCLDKALLAAQPAGTGAQN